MATLFLGGLGFGSCSEVSHAKTDWSAAKAFSATEDNLPINGDDE